MQSNILTPPGVKDSTLRSTVVCGHCLGTLPFIGSCISPKVFYSYTTLPSPITQTANGLAPQPISMQTSL